MFNPVEFLKEKGIEARLNDDVLELKSSKNVWHCVTLAYGNYVENIKSGRSPEKGELQIKMFLLDEYLLHSKSLTPTERDAKDESDMLLFMINQDMTRDQAVIKSEFS